jgi:signal transduction histidine kinase
MNASKQNAATDRAVKRILIYSVAALVLTIVVWAIAHWTVLIERERVFADSAAQAERLAVFFERQTLGILRYGDAYAKMIRREYIEHRDVDMIRQLMENIPYDQSIVSHVTIVDETGRPLLVSGHTIKPGTSASDRDYFKHQKTSEGDQIMVSLPHVGRNTGKLIVRLVRGITWPDGRFGGVIFVALEADSITEFFVAMNLGPKSSATLVGNDKRIRARSSYGRLGPGQDISGSRIWRELEQSPVGLYRQVSVVDGITRYYAYRQLSEFPLIVAIGVSTEDIHQAVKQFQLPAYVIAMLATVLLITVTILLSRETLTSQKLAASESRIRAMRDELEQRFEARTAELESVQLELLRKERLAVLGQLTGTVAHELRNPLGTITTSVAIIERKARELGVNMGETLERVQRNVKRCNSIITELLDFARATGLHLQQTNIDSWLSDVLAELSYPAGIKLTSDLGTPDTDVELDRDRLRRAVINLVDNACDAVTSQDTDAGNGEIRVATRAENGKVEIEIADNGPGISEDLMTKIHEPLFSTKTFGVGLGLPIVRRSIEEHGGGFEITSEKGRGTRAVLWLPLSGTAADGA